MTIKTFKKNYDVSLIQLRATKNEVMIEVLVTDKRTGISDVFGWDPSCYGAEPHLSSLDDDFDEEINMVVMEYMREEIWMKLPCPIASEKELELVKQICN